MRSLRRAKESAKFKSEFNTASIEQLAAEDMVQALTELTKSISLLAPHAALT